MFGYALQGGRRPKVNDQAGRKTAESITNMFEYHVTDESFRYADYKDVNEYLMRKKRIINEDKKLDYDSNKS